MKTIVFDSNASYWSKNLEMNRTYLNLQRYYLKDRLIYKGYLYLNEIYDTFGVAWNPDDENVCYRYGKGDFDIQFTGPDLENTWLIKIN